MGNSGINKISHRVGMYKLVPCHPQSEGGFFPVHSTSFFAFYVETSQAS